MRNLYFFMLGFTVIFIFGLMTACSMPLRKPEPYEQRPAQKQAQREKTEWQEVEDYVDEKKRESAIWWNCTRSHREYEC